MWVRTPQEENARSINELKAQNLALMEGRTQSHATESDTAFAASSSRTTSLGSQLSIGSSHSAANDVAAAAIEQVKLLQDEFRASQSFNEQALTEMRHQNMQLVLQLKDAQLEVSVQRSSSVNTSL